jgi:hypothetical protein
VPLALALALVLVTLYFFRRHVERVEPLAQVA